MLKSTQWGNYHSIWTGGQLLWYEHGCRKWTIERWGTGQRHRKPVWRQATALLEIHVDLSFCNLPWPRNPLWTRSQVHCPVWRNWSRELHQCACGKLPAWSEVILCSAWANCHGSTNCQETNVVSLRHVRLHTFLQVLVNNMDVARRIRRSSGHFVLQPQVPALGNRAFRGAVRHRRGLCVAAGNYTQCTKKCGKCRGPRTVTEANMEIEQCFTI